LKVNLLLEFHPEYLNISKFSYQLFILDSQFEEDINISKGVWSEEIFSIFATQQRTLYNKFEN